MTKDLKYEESCNLFKEKLRNFLDSVKPSFPGALPYYVIIYGVDSPALEENDAPQTDVFYSCNIEDEHMLEEVIDDFYDCHMKEVRVREVRARKIEKGDSFIENWISPND